jgi:hypothetical protein
MKNDNDVTNVAVLAIFILGLTIGVAIGYMTAIANWDVYIVVGILIVLWIGLFIDVYRLKTRSKNNNNHLLKPNTKYGINIYHKYISIDDRRYRYSLDTDALRLDRDVDIIITTSNPVYVTRYPDIQQTSRMIIILDEIKE